MTCTVLLAVFTLGSCNGLAGNDEMDRYFQRSDTLTLSAGDATSRPTLYGAAQQCSLTRHVNCSIDGVFQVVRVVGRGLASIAEVHAIVAGTHLAQSEPEMARDRFGVLERHRLPSAARRRGARHRVRLNGPPGWIASVAWRYEAPPWLT